MGSWKCGSCREQLKLKPGTWTPVQDRSNNDNSQDNITRRKHQQLPLKAPSCENLSQALDDDDIINSTLIDDSMFNSPCSLPNMSTMENSTTLELRLQVEELSTELSSAHAEVVRLNSENSEKQKIIDTLKKKINFFNQLINEDPLKKITPAKTYENMTVFQNISTADYISGYEHKIKSLESEILTLNDKIKNLNIKLSKALTTNSEYKRRSGALLNKEVTLSRIQNSTKVLQKTAKHIEEQISKNFAGMDSLNSTVKPSTPVKDQPSNRTTPSYLSNKKPKLLLLSDFHGADLLLPLSKIRKNDYDFSADIIQHGDTQRVLKNMHMKTASFGKGDCIIIMCGGGDYNTTPINEIMSVLDDTIKQCTHTNVVICDVFYSLNRNAEHYNYFVTKFNESLHRTFVNAAHVWLQAPNSLHFGIGDYYSNGHQLNHRGKYKLAHSLNKVLASVNEAFYNNCNFL